jgi:hypothetical protein
MTDLKASHNSDNDHVALRPESCEVPWGKTFHTACSICKEAYQFKIEVIYLLL